jgi:drug/metabolite transporter (DMT)-like permease
MIADAGAWGATLVRFLFGLPFSLAMFIGVALVTPDAAPQASARFFLATAIGAMAQVFATAALLVAIGRSGFGVATALQQSSLPFAALFGFLLLGDRLSALAWAGIALATVALVALSWPRATDAAGVRLGSLLGLASGAAFAVALNGYREAGLTLDPEEPIYSAVAAVCVAQALQSLVLGGILAVARPQALKAVLTSGATSLKAGFFGSAASACWFAALALAPAGPVRAVGVIETPIAAAVGRNLFKEKMTLRQVICAAAAAAGVVMTALG